MKCVFSHIILVFLIHNIQAQNLVPNPSFEEVDSLLCSFIQGDFGDPILDDYVKGWTVPTGATSDISSILLPDTCFANPQRLNISPRTGNNIAGMITGEPEDYREYLQVKLQEALVPGKSYYAEMYVMHNPEFPFAANNLGLYFSEIEINESIEYRGILEYTPQIVERRIIVNNKEWHKISGCFVSDKESKYLLIGNFSSVSNTEVLFLNEQGQFTAYYFIDDVYVGEVAPVVDLGNDTTLCAGETLLLDATSEGAVS